jgi:putative addiction module component (TIGR02574 family)
MDPQSILVAVEAWPVEDRLRLTDGIWAGLLDRGLEPELSMEQLAELEQRLAEDHTEPDDVISWEEVKTSALKRAGR